MIMPFNGIDSSGSTSASAGGMAHTNYRRKSRVHSIKARSGA